MTLLFLPFRSVFVSFTVCYMFFLLYSTHHKLSVRHPDTWEMCVCKVELEDWGSSCHSGYSWTSLCTEYIVWRVNGQPHVVGGVSSIGHQLLLRMLPQSLVISQWEEGKSCLLPRSYQTVAPQASNWTDTQLDVTCDMCWQRPWEVRFQSQAALPTKWAYHWFWERFHWQYCLLLSAHSVDAQCPVSV